MDAELDSAEMENEFTLAEIMEMERLHKGKGKKGRKPLNFYRELAAKFNNSAHRRGKSVIEWEEVAYWFQERGKRNLKAKVSSRKHVEKSNAAAAELSGLLYEAKSARDLAWYDVASFCNYRFVYSGELEVRVLFAGFDKDHDEWVNVKRGVRERSIPLEDLECGKVKVGDHVLCYRETEDLAVYLDARVIDIQRKIHDETEVCTCMFTVRFDFDFLEDQVQDQVQLNSLCHRPSS